MTASLVRIPTSGPADVSGADAAVASMPGNVLAVVGKTEGNGCVNDFSRELASRAWRDVLGDDVVTVMSGGTEGVLSPHVTLLADDGERSAERGTGLALAAGRTGPVPTVDLGRRAQVDLVAATVARLAATAGTPLDEVGLVLVKCPLLTSDAIRDLRERGGEPVTDDPLASMGRSRAASALGVALALGEVDDGAVDRALAGDRAAWSAVASTSSGVELDCCEVVVVGNSPRASGPLRISRTVMADALDARSVVDVLDHVDRAGGRVLQVFAKAEPPPGGTIRGRRHTMATDSDVAGSRHARAAVGGLLAGLVGEPAIYVSGGAEHQGPPGGGPVAVIWTVEGPPPP